MVEARWDISIPIGIWNASLSHDVQNNLKTLTTPPPLSVAWKIEFENPKKENTNQKKIVPVELTEGTNVRLVYVC